MKFFRLLVCLTAFFLIFSGAAKAAERVDFDAKISESSRVSLNRYIQTNFKKMPAVFAIAPVDLNEDGIEEFILQDKSCMTGCRFTVLADSKKGLIILGEIPARNILLGSEYSNGIRSLLAYENSLNDYDYKVYIWKSDANRYIMKE